MNIINKSIFVSDILNLIIVLAIIVLPFFFIHCSDGKQDPSITFYEITNSIAHLPGESEYLIEMPHGAMYHNEYIYTADLSGNRIIRLKSDFTSGDVIGKEGRGPGEFLGPAFVRTTNEAMYITEVNNNRIQILNKRNSFQQFIYTNTFPGQTFGLTPHNTLLIHSWHPDVLLKEYNEFGDTIRSFGTNINSNPLLNSIMVETDSLDNVYVAFIGAPIIRKYNPRRELVWENELYHLVRDQESVIKNDYDGLRFVTLAFGIHQDNLYIHLGGQTLEEYGGIKIFIFCCTDGELIGKMVIKLDKLRSLLGGFSFAPDGTVYFADLGNAEIVQAKPISR